MKNTGRPSEKAFEHHFERMGKNAFVHRLVDAAEIKGRTGVVGEARAQPSDYILVYNGKTYFAEVKSSSNKTSFAFSLLRKTQTAFARRIIAAGGEHIVFVHSLANSQWYLVPYQTIIETIDSGEKSSIKWQDMVRFKYDGIKDD